MEPNATEKWPPRPRRRVYLMRHGEVDYFGADGRPFRPELVPLNADGRRQAQTAATALGGVPFDRVLTSGLRRSVETAELVVAGRGLAVEHDPRLREIETGRLSDWAGVGPQQARAALLGALGVGLTPESTFLGGETFACLRARVEACWAELLGRSDWTHLLVVAHGVANRLLLSGLLGAGLGAVGVLEQDAGCINLIEVGEGGTCLVRAVNYTQ